MAILIKNVMRKFSLKKRKYCLQQYLSKIWQIQLLALKYFLKSTEIE